MIFNLGIWVNGHGAKIQAGKNGFLSLELFGKQETTMLVMRDILCHCLLDLLRLIVVSNIKIRLLK